jgi:RHS repeat-associated protein
MLVEAKESCEGQVCPARRTTPRSAGVPGRNAKASYYRARYYDPTAGRFTSEDPIGFDGDGVDFYPYANDNPTNFFDPYGEQGSGTATAPAPVKPPQPIRPPIVDPTPPLPEPEPVVPKPISPSGVPIVGPMLGALGLILGSPADLNSGEDQALRRRDDECRRKGKWHCVAKCQVRNFSRRPNMPDWVYGEGWGSSEAEAWLAAQKDANDNIKRLGTGIYKGHCHKLGGKCEKR